MDIISPLRVLGIEDDQTLSLFFSRAMRRAGFDVEMRDCGDTGLAAALTGKFDVVVLDFHLPGMDGMTVISHIRAAKIRVRILMLSGSGDFVRREALAAGADAFLGKPCGLDHLVAAIAAVAEQPSPGICAA